MTIYHGSTVPVEHPEIRVGKNLLDFGIGFYTTTSYDQAERWAKIKMRRENKDTGYVAVYTFDYESAKKNTVIRQFETASIEWLLFVVNNRRGVPFTEQVDMHIGPVADDTIYQTIRFFESGVYDAAETVKRLKTETLHDQWAFHTEKILSYLQFTAYKKIQEETGYDQRLV